jgi:hypothetical protein
MEESCGEGEVEEEEEGEEEGDDVSQNSNSSKRQRRDSGSGQSSRSNSNSSFHINVNTTNGTPMGLWTVYVDSEADVGMGFRVPPDTHDRMGVTARNGTPLPLPLPLPGDNTDTTITTTRRAAASLISNMITTSIAERAPSSSNPGGVTTKETFEYKDWERIKETLTCASELCDRAWLCYFFCVFMTVLSPCFFLIVCKLKYNLGTR